MTHDEKTHCSFSVGGQRCAHPADGPRKGNCVEHSYGFCGFWEDRTKCTAYATRECPKCGMKLCDRHSMRGWNCAHIYYASP